VLPDTVLLTCHPSANQLPPGFRTLGFDKLEVIDIPV
jgi:predicted N-formylglutamate amidohydrolase